jgi:nitrite reductase/ring-hydroxylating ferredoxin subunit
MSTTRCAGCGGQPDRRAFLRELAALAAAAAGSLGVGASRLAALPIGFATGRPVGSDEAAYPIPGGDGATIDQSHEVILVRWQQAVYAFSLSCPHQKTPLRWQADEHQFRCPKHKSRFQPDGSFIDGRATRNMDRFAIRREGEEVRVALDKLFREDENREAWVDAVVRL